MYIGKDLLFPESDNYLLKHTETLQVVYSPVSFEYDDSTSSRLSNAGVTFNTPVEFQDTMKSLFVIDPSDSRYSGVSEVEISGKLNVAGTSNFVDLITGTITHARWS